MKKSRYILNSIIEKKCYIFPDIYPDIKIMFLGENLRKISRNYDELKEKYAIFMH